MDGTLTSHRSSWQRIHEALGIWSGRAERYQERFRAGEISYDEFCRLDALEWRGIESARIREICDQIPYNPGARELASDLRKRGLRLGIVSTGLTHLSRRVAGELGFDFAVANELIEAGGRLTGELGIHVSHGAKAEVLREFSREEAIPPAAIAAIGDSEGDIPLFEAAGLGVAFNPASPEVAGAADLVVEGTDLRAVSRLLFP